MANTNQAQTISAFKRLAGRANTGANKAWYEENIPSALQSTTQTILGDEIPQSISAYTSSAHFPSRYDTVTNSSGQVIAELVPFVVETIGGTNYDDDTLGDPAGDPLQNSGFHGYQLKLPADYESSSNLAAAGTGFLVNNQVIHESNGKLQLLSPTMAPNAKPYLNMNLWTSATSISASTGDNYNGITATDPTDWVPDFYNGTVFFQDYDASKVPLYAMAWMYVGKMADEKITDASGSGGSGGISYSRTAITANATASVNDVIIGVSSSGDSDNIEIRLPDASDLSNGQYYTIKKEDNFASTVTISPSGTQNIDGQNNSIVIESGFGAVNLYTDGSSNYFIY